jgi:hypothetical protein
MKRTKRAFELILLKIHRIPARHFQSSQRIKRRVEITWGVKQTTPSNLEVFLRNEGLVELYISVAYYYNYLFPGIDAGEKLCIRLGAVFFKKRTKIFVNIYQNNIFKSYKHY